MLKIKDKTTKKKMPYIDCTFWDDFIIQDIVYWLIIDCSKDEIIITDDVVERYNILANQNKSSASFVRRVRKLNKEGYFKVEDK